MIVFLCKDDFETILCGIYDAWCQNNHNGVRLEIDACSQRELFCEYREVKREEDKAEKVIRSVKRKLSEEYFETLYHLFLSCDKRKADVMYRFLIKGFSYGEKALDMLQDKDIMQAFEMKRFVGREGHCIIEFLRFEKSWNGVYVAKINPKNHVLPIIAEHFAERLNTENFLIYDENRKEAVVHPSQKPWFFIKLHTEEWKDIFHKIDGGENDMIGEKEDYGALFKVFVDTIAVEGRINPKLQRQMMPYRYRNHMPELNKTDG